MKNILFLSVILSMLMLTSCGMTKYKTSKILKQDEAQLAITLNKGYTTTVISTNDGKRLEPTCIVNKGEFQKETTLPKCDDTTHAAKGGKVLYEQTYHVTVREGSLCIEIDMGNYTIKACDPPNDFSGLKQ